MSNSSPVAPATALTILDNEIRCINSLYSLTICIALLVVKINIRYVIDNKNIKLFDLINFIEKGGIPSVLKKQGIGTFVCKELVIAYAAWISLKFHLAVIRAFIATIDDDDDNYQPTERVIKLEELVNIQLQQRIATPKKQLIVARAIAVVDSRCCDDW